MERAQSYLAVGAIRLDWPAEEFVDRQDTIAIHIQARELRLEVRRRCGRQDGERLNGRKASRAATRGP